MDVAVKFIVDVVVANVLQRCSTSGAFEALNVKILLLYSYEHATTHANIFINVMIKSLFNELHANITDEIKQV